MGAVTLTLSGSLFLLDWAAAGDAPRRVQRALIGLSLLAVLAVVAIAVFSFAGGGRAQLLTVAAGLLVGTGVVFAIALVALPPDSAPAILGGTTRALVPIVGFLSLVPLYGKHASLPFYGAASQIIPVLLLVLAVEGRAFVLAQRQRLTSEMVNQRREQQAAALFSIGMLTALGLGEAASLHALATERPFAVSYGITTGALISGFLGLFAFALLGRFGPNPPPPEP